MIIELKESECKHLILSLQQSIATMKDEHKKVSLLSALSIQSGINDFEKLKTLMVSYWDYDQDGLPPLDNTMLINAAPDLLQALERAVALIAWELKHDVTNEWPNVSGVKQDIENAARAAIAKAIGEKL